MKKNILLNFTKFSFEFQLIEISASIASTSIQLKQKFRKRGNHSKNYEDVSLVLMLHRNGREHKWIKITAQFHVHFDNNCNFLNTNVSSNLTKTFFLLVNNQTGRLAKLNKNNLSLKI